MSTQWPGTVPPGAQSLTPSAPIIRSAAPPMIELHVLTREDPADAVPTPAIIPCTGEMTCTCAPCQTERAQRMRQPRRPTRYPWEDVA